MSLGAPVPAALKAVKTLDNLKIITENAYFQQRLFLYLSAKIEEAARLENSDLLRLFILGLQPRPIKTGKIH